MSIVEGVDHDCEPSLRSSARLVPRSLVQVLHGMKDIPSDLYKVQGRCHTGGELHDKWPVHQEV